MRPPPKPLPQGPVSAKQQLRDLAATLKLVWHSSPGHTITMLLCSLLLAAVPAATLWVTKLLLDAVALATQGRLEQAGGYSALLAILGLQVGIGALGTLLTTVQNASRELLGDRLQSRITLQILRKATALEVERFEDAETYDRLQAAYREVGLRPLGVLTGVTGLLQAALTLASVGALMSSLGPLVLPLVLLATVPGVWVQSRFGTETYRMLRYRTHDSRVQNYFGSILTSDTLVKEVRLFHFEPYLLARWEEYYRKFRAQLEDLVRRRSAWNLGAALFSALMVGLATWTVLERAARGQITVGDFSLLALGIAQVQTQFSGLLGGVSGIYQNLLYMRNLFEFLELPARDLDAGLEWQEPIESVEFQEVGFRYPLTERDVLRNVSFRIERGQTLALVGENGAGKTTVVKLLTRLFEPTRGRILINGQDASRYSPRSLQRQMSIIFQDFGQYQLSAAENVRLSQALEADLGDARLNRAGERSGANAFVSELPQGYGTLLGRLFSGGRQLSGGQWQRLALSRLYYRDASLLVFDEPTAALDASAEFETIEALRREARERIAVIISHRFSTVRLADRIVVLEGGEILEAGTHDELLALGGRYAALYRLQARGYQEAGTAG
ncbi:ATP-binding cassette subfamily B protein [Deinobacterium chartae]|uniref:ATP-binding cassette subfamily B protein n=1 Tax=Deinobacterium chartae TaxID=521158 RepID=A0A841HXF2_9DEIO|nr:ABC transporter ATP-binding protein [Deinobacterium chartae]MBB6096880.1 ATP-binding cassette subfamily B protein [Deinobacterium chartae]